MNVLTTLAAHEPELALTTTPSTLHQAFERQARRTPQAIALTLHSRHMTYAELDQRANTLAAHLCNRGARPGDLIALYLERSFQMLIAILAVLKTGAAYVPIDLAYPPERAHFMLQDTQARLVVTTRSLASVLPADSGKLVCVDDPVPEGHFPPPAAVPHPEDLAYVIYTSGSTGNPKGVMVTHQNVLRLLEQTRHWYRFDSQDVWPLFHSYAFDVSVWEIWGCLLHGGRLVIVPYLLTRSPGEFYELLARERVTVLNQTPSAFRQLIWAEGTLRYRPQLFLRWVICAGEALELQSLRPWFDVHGEQKPQIVNMYGITETTVHSTFRVIRAADLSANRGSVIGVPIPDLRLTLVDAHLRPVPPGEVGEICVAGAGVAQGYLNQPELTAQRFLPDRLSDLPGQRLYRSGDLARYTPDGELEYLGRMDHQVKIRGFRVELGEIESALNSIPAVRESVVVIDGPDFDKRLLAYVVPRAQMPPVGQLRSRLAARLPDYMIPALFIPLSQLPLTTNGKIDRRSLPRPDGARPSLTTSFVVPANQIEQSLADIWRRVLQISSVGAQDNFFELGGDSIRSIRVLAEAAEQGIELTLPELYSAPTIRGSASLARPARPSAPSAPPPFSLVSSDDRTLMPPGVEDAYPCTQLQLGMFFRNELDPLSAIYHDVFSYSVRLPWKPELFDQAVGALVRRHPVLRTSFQLAGFSQPLQLVHTTAQLEISSADVRQLAKPAQDQALLDWITAEKRRAFRREHPGLARFHVLQPGDTAFHLVLSFHHSCLDGWSLATVISDLLRHYTALLSGIVEQAAAPKTSYSEFVRLEQESLHSEHHRSFWRENIAGAVPGQIPRWPQRYCQEAREQRRGPEVWIPDPTLQKLQGLAQSAGVPLKSVLLAAHQKVMAFLAGTNDVLSGLITNGRPETRDGELLAGLFLNATPFRTVLSQGSWLQLVKQVFSQEQHLLPFRRFPMAEVQKLSGQQRLFETAFDFVHFHVLNALKSDPQIRLAEGPYFEANDMATYTTFMLDTNTGRLELHLDFNPALVAREQVERITDYYLATLEAMSASPAVSHVGFSPLSVAERKQILQAWNDTDSEIPEISVLDLIGQQVRIRPEAVAVCDASSVLTYSALDQHSAGVLSLIREQGVRPGDLVGVCLERSVKLVPTLLGIWRAGAAYVPMDPLFPRERLAHMVADARPSLIVTDPASVAHLPDINVPKLVLAQPLADSTLEAACVPTDRAYVIYTSGSTGKPKGVEIEHRSLVNLLLSAASTTNFKSSDRLLAVTTLSFDIAALEIFLPLICGGTVEIAHAEVSADATLLKRLLASSSPDFMQATPTTWKMLIESGWAGSPRLKILCGGEPLKPALAEQLCHRAARLWNFYGPTETTVWSTAAEVRPAGELTIGGPLANTRVYILRDACELAPVGSAGELCIAGAGVARGYLNAPDLTRERFVPDPFASPGSRMYRTGDLARWLPDGQIECLGRLDRQVKIRGYRVETAEIEVVLKQHHGIADALVTASENGFGDNRLVGYVISRNGPPSFTELRDFARTRLPHYMVPAHFVLLREFPVTPNGKLDLRRLPPPEQVAIPSRSRVSPRNQREQRIADIWREVLGVKDLGVDDNFFELGGDSLSATRVFARVAAQFSTEISLRDLFEHPTIGQLAGMLSDESPVHAALSRIPRLPR